MKKVKDFKISFKGKLKGAIGIVYPIVVVLELDEDITRDKIETLLYKNYDNITQLKVEES